MKLILILGALFISTSTFAQWQDAFSTQVNQHLIIGGKNVWVGK